MHGIALKNNAETLLTGLWNMHARMAAKDETWKLKQEQKQMQDWCGECATHAYRGPSRRRTAQGRALGQGEQLKPIKLSKWPHTDTLLHVHAHASTGSEQDHGVRARASTCTRLCGIYQGAPSPVLRRHDSALRSHRQSLCRNRYGPVFRPARPHRLELSPVSSCFFMHI